MRERGEMREAKAPLIAEAAEHISHSHGSGSSGTGSHTSGGGGGWRGSRQYQRRSDALAYGDRYQKAAALVDLAEDGVGIPEDVLNDTRFERAMRFYFVYLRLDWLWSLNLFALILLNFLEVSYENGTHLLHCTGKRLKSCKSHYGHVLSCFFCISEAYLVPGIFSTCL